ncbi:hypothetical protein QMK17_13845 [Rhodococcus sp. G-MC3]|uniref:hypothetical protein n=1 Tax=Rhodococcus sp. G-MC3 TaxID=3046209 RepID=UPI0024B9CCB8|nr:hypothetical protein [Rhodococcus sp. G-MC3]MDJ0394411.1 hypothetical protein [Rhodococcus sp. G-MC3]
MGGIEGPKEQLARLVVERIRFEGGAEPRVDHDVFAVRYGDDSVLYLDNLLRDTATVSALARESHVAHFVSTEMSSKDWPGNWNDALPRLRPVLKPSTYTLGPPSGLLLSRRVFPLVDELVAVDMPGHRATVSWSTIDKWGVDPSTVFAAARSNLATITQHADPTKGRAIQRLIDDGGRYYTSWLLDPGWLESHRGRLGCPPVAFVPDVNTIFVLPSDDPELLAKHFAMVEQQYIHTSRALSPQAYTVDDAGSVVTLDTVNPEDPGTARARCVHIAHEYAAQSSWLTRQYELEHVHSFVGTVTVKTTPFGPRTVTIWGDGIDYTMPHTDLVAFCQQDAPPFYVQFGDVAAITGIAPVAGFDPRRYRVSSWPDWETVEQLRAYSIPVG